MDVSAMADRLSAAVSSGSTSTSAADSTPAAESAPQTETHVESTPPSVPGAPAQAQVPAEDPALNFEDDEPELDFDAPVAPAAAAPETPVTAPPVPGSEFDNMLPKAVETAFLKTNRGRNLLATYKSERVLKEAPNYDPATGENTGGLGYMPTPEQIKDYHARASDFDAMQQEFVTNPESWAINHFGVGPDGNLKDGAIQTLSMLPKVINSVYDAAVKSGNTQLQEQAAAAYKAFFQPAAMEYISGLYDRARAIQDPVKREQYLNGARTIEYDLTGQFRADDQLAPPTQNDALAAERAQIQAEKNELLSWKQRSTSEAVTQVRSQVFTDIDQSVTRDIERAFATAGLDKTMRPFAYQAAINAFKVQVQQGVRRDQATFRSYNFALAKLGPNSTAEQRQEAAKIYQQSARQVIRNSYRTVIKELVGDTVTQNATTRATAAAAASQTAPSVNGGQPPSQSVVPIEQVQRRRGEDNADFFQRRLQARLGVPQH